MNHKCLRTQGHNDWSHDNEPCECGCPDCEEWRRIRALPPVDLNNVRDLWHIWQSELTPGPWKYEQLEGFGHKKYIVTGSKKDQWYKVVAQLENVGTFTGSQALASCRDGVPRLLKTIENLYKENDELRKRIEEMEDHAQEHAWERDTKD